MPIALALFEKKKVDPLTQVIGGSAEKSPRGGRHSGIGTPRRDDETPNTPAIGSA
jgi:hypothetical protein